jgi:hypothetical protein
MLNHGSSTGVRRVRVRQRQVDAQRLIAGRVSDEIDRALDVRPVAVMVDAGLIVGRQPAVADEEGVVVVTARRAAPFVVAVGHPHGTDGLGRGVVLDVAVRVEPVLAGDEIVLAAPPDVVAAVLQRLEQVRLAELGVEHVVHRPVAADVRVPAGHERAAARRADRVLAVRPAERDGPVVAHEPVEVGRDRRRISEVADDVAAPLVRVDDEDVRRVRHASQKGSRGTAIPRLRVLSPGSNGLAQWFRRVPTSPIGPSTGGTDHQNSQSAPLRLVEYGHGSART